MISSMLQMMSSTGILLGEMEKLIPFSISFLVGTFSSRIERLTTSLLGSLVLILWLVEPVITSPSLGNWLLQNSFVLVFWLPSISFPRWSQSLDSWFLL